MRDLGQTFFHPVECFAAVCFLLAIAGGEVLAVDRISVDVGLQKTVLPAGHFGLRCFPDVAISVLSTRPLAFYVVNTSRTELLQGPAFESARPMKVVLEPSGGTAFDCSYAGVSAIYQWRPKKELLAFYHAEDSSGMGKNEHNALLTNAYWSIGLAVSRDGGRTLERMGQILTSSQTKDVNRADMQGLGDVSVCADRTNEFLHAYYTDLSQMPKQPARICVARSRIADGGRPKTWKKFHKGAFSEEGLGGLESGIIPDACNPNATFVKAIDKYVMIFSVTDWPEHQRGKAERSGFYYSLSSDGLTWSDPEKLFSTLTVPLIGKEFAAHPYFHVQTATDGTVSGQLFYAYTPHFGSPPDGEHFLVKRSLRFSIPKRDTSPPEPAEKPSAFVFKSKSFIQTPLKRFSPSTLEAWIKPVAVPKDMFVFGSMSTAQGIGLGLNHGVLRAQYLVGDIGASASAPPDRWSHIAAVYDEGGTHLYFDGRRVGSGPPNTPMDEAPVFMIGAIGKGLLENCFEGQIRSVRISKGSRFQGDFSPDEIFRADAKASPTAAVLIYDASLTKPGEATDLSGFGNHGEPSEVVVEAIRE